LLNNMVVIGYTHICTHMCLYTTDMSGIMLHAWLAVYKYDE